MNGDKPNSYRRLEHGEIVQVGDEVDRCADPWRDDPVWEPAGNIGEPAPDPQYPSHRQFRRPVDEFRELSTGNYCARGIHGLDDGWVTRMPGFAWFAHHHLGHHQRPSRNFGVVCIWSDWIFRTRRRHIVVEGD